MRCLELMSQEISINFDVSIYFHFQRFDEISKINFNPGFFNRSLNFRNFYLKLFKFGNFVIE